MLLDATHGRLGERAVMMKAKVAAVWRRIKNRKVKI
jgi:hypothetical protein